LYRYSEENATAAMAAALRERSLREELASAETHANKVAAEAWGQLGGVTKQLEVGRLFKSNPVDP
jgi:hypothetical protein